MAIIHLDINGDDYVLTKYDSGYRICRNTNRTDHFHRVYSVNCAANGIPLKCSCPHCYEKESYCKHLRAIEKWWRESTEEGREEQRRLAEWAERSGFFSDTI